MKRVIIFLAVGITAMAFGGCSSDDNNSDSGQTTPPEARIAVSTGTANPRYGDEIAVTGLLTDSRNLDKYVLTLTDETGDTLATKTQPLLGQTFRIDDAMQIPLPRNARRQNMRLHFRLTNTTGGEYAEQFDIEGVQLPDFPTLHLCIADGQTIDLVKDGDFYVSTQETIFAAGIKGIISTKNGKTGIWWGTKNGEITAMAKDSITIGADVEASCTVAFNPVTFELQFGERHVWTLINSQRTYYLLGTISGDWRDGEIAAEKQKMKMTGYESGDRKYYTWTAPEGDDIETGMGGTTAAGTFRIKFAGAKKYILWDGQKIVQTNTDDKQMSFPLTMAGAFTIRANFRGDTCYSVDITGEGRSVTFSNDGVTANGYTLTDVADFGGTAIARQEGAAYIYEGRVSMATGQTVSSTFDLSRFYTNTDLFDGQGNSAWTLRTKSGEYIVRLDAFSGTFYGCPVAGYPDYLYLDGWSWAAREDATPVSWDAAQALPLVRQTDGTYQARLYVFPWGGNFRLYTGCPSIPDADSQSVPTANFDGDYIDTAYDDVFLFPQTEGYYRLVIDLSGTRNKIEFKVE